MLIMSLIIAAVLGITLASYLILTETQTVSIFRSQSWNTSLVLTEAGVEGRPAAHKSLRWYMDPNEMPKWTNYVTAENWDTVAANVYHMHRRLALSNGSRRLADKLIRCLGYKSNDAPVIYSIGNVPWTFSMPLAALHYVCRGWISGGLRSGRRAPTGRTQRLRANQTGSLIRRCHGRHYHHRSEGKNISTDSSIPQTRATRAAVIILTGSCGKPRITGTSSPTE